MNNLIKISHEDLFEVNGGGVLGSVGDVCMGTGTAIFGLGLGVAVTGVGTIPGGATSFFGGFVTGVGAGLKIIDSL